MQKSWYGRQRQHTYLDTQNDRYHESQQVADPEPPLVISLSRIDHWTFAHTSCKVSATYITSSSSSSGNMGKERIVDEQLSACRKSPTLCPRNASAGWR